MSEFAIICGLSGAGRSQAAGALEDLGWFVADNVPAALIPTMGELAGARGAAYDKVGLVVRSGVDDVAEVLSALDQLARTARRVRTVFLEASTDVLVRRYESSRRRHPWADDGRSLAEAIEAEREQLGALKAAADVVVDTSELNVHQLRARMVDLFGDAAGGPGPRINVVSFGYKHGLPLDVDIVLDCRFLPNPHWVDELRPLTGRDPAVREYVLDQPDAQAFLDRLEAVLDLLLPAYAREGRTYLSIALGCTGGRHRSVALAEAVAELLRRRGYDPAVTHRDLDR